MLGRGMDLKKAAGGKTIFAAKLGGVEYECAVEDDALFELAKSYGPWDVLLFPPMYSQMASSEEKDRVARAVAEIQPGIVVCETPSYDDAMERMRGALEQ